MKTKYLLSKKLLPLILLVLSITQIGEAQFVARYNLFVKDTNVSLAGKEKRAIAVNGQISMPTLTFTEGDTAEEHFMHFAPMFEIGSTAEFVLSEPHRLRLRYPKITIAP